jgi:hypothetical protein
VYVDELRKVFYEVAHISSNDLRTEQWSARLGLILNEIGYPLATLSAKGSRVPIRESVAKLRKLLETDVDERVLIASLKTALAERVYEIQMAHETSQHRIRSAAACGRRKAVKAAGAGSEAALANISLCSITK